jgi:PAS domain S-box-containing protein
MAAFAGRAARSPRPLRALLAVALLVPVLLFALLALEARQHALDAAAEHTRKTVAILHEHALKVFETQDRMLKQVDLWAEGREWEVIDRDERLQRNLRKLGEANDVIESIGMVDGNGMMRVGSKPLPGPLDQSHREYFTAQRNGAGGRHITAPFVSSVSGAPVFAMSRWRTAMSGAFDGVILVLINPRYFVEFWKSVGKDLKSNVLLVREDGALLARYPELPEPNTWLSGDASLMRAFARASEGTATGLSAINGSERIFSYKKLAGYPVYVTFSMSREVVLEGWHRDLARYGAFALTAMIGLAVLGWVVLRRARAQAEAEASARESQAQLRAILESTTDSVCVLDREWRFSYLNRRAKAALGDRDLIGADGWEAFPEVVGTAIWDEFHKVMAERVPVDFETHVATLGSWIEIHARPLGEGIAVFFRNITERRLADDRVRQSEERYRLAARASGCAVWDWDPASGRIERSDGSPEILGYPPDEVEPTYQWWESKIHPEDHDRVSRSFAAACDGGGEFWEDEYRFRRGDGSYAYMLDRAYALYDSAGKPVRMIGAMLDITQRKRMEEELRRSAAHLARAQQVASLGSFEHDVRAGTHRWSDEKYRIYGLDRATFAPTIDTIDITVHPDDRATFRRLPEMVLRGERPTVADLSTEYRVVRPDGAVRVVQRQCELILDAAGGIVAVVGTVQDVTERREAEERRRELETRLLHAQKMEALGTLAGGIAHDLNNTLLPILALSKLSQTALPKDSDAYGNLEIVRQAGGRARDLVKQILAFSRREAPRKEAVDLAHLAEAALGMLRATIPATVRIETTIERTPAVLGDATQLHQVLLNLVTNAAQAIGGSCGTIRVALSAAPAGLAEPVAEVILTVSDTGSGMDEATRRRIFEPFFTTKNVNEGTGLGLSVVDGIVAGHGGRVEVTSAPGAGTTFTVRLPALVDDAARPEGRELKPRAA